MSSFIANIRFLSLVAFSFCCQVELWKLVLLAKAKVSIKTQSNCFTVRHGLSWSQNDFLKVASQCKFTDFDVTKLDKMSLPISVSSCGDSYKGTPGPLAIAARQDPWRTLLFGD